MIHDFTTVSRGAKLDVAELVESYRHAAESHTRSTETGDSDSANRAAYGLAVIYSELRRRGRDAQERLLPLLHDQSSGVRLWAGAHALEFAPSEGALVLESLAAKGAGILGLSAAMTLKEWCEGRLRFPDPE
jgi:hypothetical protein